MFRAIISPILRSTRLCLQLVVYSTDDAACWPEDGRNFRPKHVELIENINKTIIVASSWLLTLLYYSVRGFLTPGP